MVIDPLLRQRPLEFFLGFLSGWFEKGELLFERASHEDLEGQDNKDGRRRGDDVGVSPSVQSDGCEGSVPLR